MLYHRLVCAAPRARLLRSLRMLRFKKRTPVRCPPARLPHFDNKVHAMQNSFSAACWHENGRCEWQPLWCEPTIAWYQACLSLRLLYHERQTLHNTTKNKHETQEEGAETHLLAQGAVMVQDAPANPARLRSTHKNTSACCLLRSVSRGFAVCFSLAPCIGFRHVYHIHRTQSSTPFLRFRKQAPRDRTSDKLWGEHQADSVFSERAPCCRRR